MKYDKRPTTVEEQIQILESRGVKIDSEDAARVLEFVNYYRFCGYGLFFEEFDGGVRLDKFQEKTTFSQIYELYLWDERLRFFLQKYLGYFEILFRSILNYTLVNDTQDPLWYINKDLFNETMDLVYLESESVAALDRAVENNELSAAHFKEAYPESKYPPCWMMAEFFSFGKWSKIFGALKHKTHVKKVASKLKAPPDDVSSWIRSLVILRNRCAHHGRLWDYHYKIRPSLTPAMRRKGLDNGSLGTMIYILYDLLSANKSAQDLMKVEFDALMKECPQDPMKAIGVARNFTL